MFIKKANMINPKPLLTALLTIALNGCVNVVYIPNNKGYIQIKPNTNPNILNGNDLDTNLSLRELKPPISSGIGSH
ncbi:hypothetical protein VCSRO104_3457 [Vibrio cholerae]|nr:hypothetical protein VCSRO104_3457 [Vibrio cholerae]